jgi:hypothetical protein
MMSANQAAIVALLEGVESAHGTYETNVLGGVRDEEWPKWYASYLLAHGLGERLGTPDLSSENLATRLTQLDAEYRQAQPNVPWTEFYARRLLTSGL